MNLGVEEWKKYIVDKYFSYKEPRFEIWAKQFSSINRDKVVVHIPAREGSERIPGKNIRVLCDVTLIAYTIAVEKAIQADRIIVNTNSSKYAAIAERYGAEVPFLRPQELSDNFVSPGLSSFYAQRYLMDEGYPISAFIDMYPTTPFRNVGKQKHYIKQLNQYGHCVTCILPEFSRGDIYKSIGLHSKKITQNTSDKSIFFKFFSSFVGVKLNPYEIISLNFPSITDPVELIDIDVEADFQIAEYIIENDLYNFGVKIC